MLIAGDTIAVIGYSYEHGGTEVGLFNVDAAGKLSYQSTYHLRSDDYYSSRNYASRLIGNKLIFYISVCACRDLENPLDGFPAVASGTRARQMTSFNPSRRQLTSIVLKEICYQLLALRCTLLRPATWPAVVSTARRLSLLDHRAMCSTFRLTPFTFGPRPGTSRKNVRRPSLFACLSTALDQLLCASRAVRSISFRFCRVTIST